MKLKNSIYNFYYDMTINELRLMNTKHHYPNITYHSIMYLDIISYKENCTVSFLAEALNISKSAVTIKVNELIKQGLVIKTQSTIDKRINYLTVNQSIIDEYKAYDKILMHTITQIESRYSAEEVNIFTDILQIFSENFSIGATSNE